MLKRLCTLVLALVFAVPALADTTITINVAADGTTSTSGGGSSAPAAADPSACWGRLTLASGDPAPRTDQAGKSTVYFTPYKGDRVSLWTGTEWCSVQTAEVSITLSGLTSGKNYDVFGKKDAEGAFALELSAAWTNDTTRADALALQSGVRVKSADKKLRFLGTFRTSSTSTTEDTATKRWLVNWTHRIAAPMLACPGYSNTDADTQYEFTGTSWAKVSGDTQSDISYLSNGEDPVNASSHIIGTYMSGSSSGQASLHSGVGVDGATPVTEDIQTLLTANSQRLSAQAPYRATLTEGFHTLSLLCTTTNASATLYWIASTPFYGGSTAQKDTRIEALVAR